MVEEIKIAHKDIDEKLTQDDLTNLEKATDKYLQAKKKTHGLRGVIGRIGYVIGCKPSPDMVLEKTRGEYLEAKGRYIRDESRRVVNGDLDSNDSSIHWITTHTDRLIGLGDDGLYQARLAVNMTELEIQEMHRLAQRDHELNRPNILKRIGGVFVKNPALRFATGMGLNVAIGLGVATGNIPAVGLAFAARTALGAYGLKGAMDGIENLVHQRRGGRDDTHIPRRAPIPAALPPDVIERESARRHDENRTHATRWIDGFVKTPTSRMSARDYLHYKDAVHQYRESFIDKIWSHLTKDKIKDHKISSVAPESQPEVLVNSMKTAMSVENEAYVIQRERMNRRCIIWEGIKWAGAIGLSAALTGATHPQMLHYVLRGPDPLLGTDSSLNGFTEAMVANNNPMFRPALTKVDTSFGPVMMFDPFDGHKVQTFWSIWRNPLNIAAANQDYTDWHRVLTTNLSAQRVLNGDLIHHTPQGFDYFNPADRGRFLPWHPTNVVNSVKSFYDSVRSSLPVVA